MMTNNPYDMLDSAFRPFAEWLCERAGIQCGEQVMDLGAGKGTSTDVVLKKTFPHGKVFAVDPDADALKELEDSLSKEDRERIRIVTARAEDLEVHFQRAEFDAVISNFSFHLFKEQASVLNRICKLLKPGGRVAFSVPGAQHVKEFRQVLMKVLSEMDLKESFTNSGPLVPDNEMIYGWCGSNEDRWRSWSMEEKRITLRCSPDDYLAHMVERGGAKRILSRLPNDLNQTIWEAIRTKLKATYGETGMPMTLHALAMYKKISHRMEKSI